MNFKALLSTIGTRYILFLLLNIALTASSVVFAQEVRSVAMVRLEPKNSTRAINVSRHFPSAIAVVKENGPPSAPPVFATIRFASDEPIGRTCFERLRAHPRVGFQWATAAGDQAGNEIKITLNTRRFTRGTDTSLDPGFAANSLKIETIASCADCETGEIGLGSAILQTNIPAQRAPGRFRDDPSVPADTGFRWGPAIQQSLIFLGIQHGFALATQSRTRHALADGNFFVDYYRSAKSLRGWSDGGKIFTNYIAHPMQGALTGFIHVQNDPNGIKQQFGASKGYWRSRSYAFLWSTFWSTQFEIGPISQASIGNIGLKGKQTWGDIVITPTVGTGWLIAEDALDRYLIRHLEHNKNLHLRIFFRIIFNPVRSSANLLRFKIPWYRDRPLGH